MESTVVMLIITDTEGIKVIKGADQHAGHRVEMFCDKFWWSIARRWTDCALSIAAVLARHLTGTLGCGCLSHSYAAEPAK